MIWFENWLWHKNIEVTELKMLDYCHKIKLFNIINQYLSTSYVLATLVGAYIFIHLFNFVCLFYPQGKTKPYVNGTPTYFREDLKPWEKSPILKPSAPQPIPSNRIDTSVSSSWVAGSFR